MKKEKSKTVVRSIDSQGVKEAVDFCGGDMEEAAALIIAALTGDTSRLEEIRARKNNKGK